MISLDNDVNNLKSYDVDKNFEDENVIIDIFKEEFNRKYDLYGPSLIRYILLRFIILNDIKKDNILKQLEDTVKLTEFLLDELNIKKENDKILFQNRLIYINSILYDSLNNIPSNILFRYEMEFNDINSEKLINYLLIDLENIYKYQDLQAKKYKIRAKKTNISSVDKKIILKLFALDKLNDIFNVNVKKTTLIDGFQQEITDVYEQRSRKIFEKFLVDNEDYRNIDESILEDYIIKNLDLIKPGLKYAGRQYNLKEGIIDIVSIDEEGIYNIIEVKNDIDERLVWQSIYYPMAFKKEKKLEKVKMITVSTIYSQAIIDTLNHLNETNNFDISIKQIDIEVKDKKIIDAKIIDKTKR